VVKVTQHLLNIVIAVMMDLHVTSSSLFEYCIYFLYVCMWCGGVYVEYAHDACDSRIPEPSNQVFLEQHHYYSKIPDSVYNKRLI
jgi:hypothetical protein